MLFLLTFTGLPFFLYTDNTITTRISMPPRTVCIQLAFYTFLSLLQKHHILTYLLIFLNTYVDTSGNFILHSYFKLFAWPVFVIRSVVPYACVLVNTCDASFESFFSSSVLPMLSLHLNLRAALSACM